MGELVARSRSAMNLILAATVLLAWSVRPGRDVVPVSAQLWEFISTAQPHESTVPTSVRGLLDARPEALTRAYELKAEDPKRYARAVNEHVSQLPVDALLTAARDTRAAQLDGAKKEAEASLPKLRVWAQTLPQVEREQLGSDDALIARQVRTLTNRPEFSAASTAITALERFVREGDPKAERGLSVMQLDNELARAGGIQVPVVEERLPGNLAVALISLALCGPYLFLLSLCAAFSPVIAVSKDAAGSDWLFFHPGKLGPALGAMWLLGPAITVAAHWMVVDFHGIAPAALAVTLAAIASITLRESLRIRQEFLARMEFLRTVPHPELGSESVPFAASANGGAA